MEIRCRALLFDMDGVLVDSTPAVARVWTAWATERGLDPDDVVRRAHGRPSIATIRELLPNAITAPKIKPSRKPKSKTSRTSSLFPAPRNF